MRIRIITLLAIVFSSFMPAFGQTQIYAYTKEQNNNWLDSLSLKKLGAQLDMVGSRILNDTNYFIKENPIYICGFARGIHNTREKKDSIITTQTVNWGSNRYVESKPILMIESIVITFKNRKNNEVYLDLVNLLTEKHISEVSLYKGNTAFDSLFCTNSSSGVIVIKLRKKKYLKKFKKLNFQTTD